MSDPATVPCISCGADIPRTAKVCGYCGVRQPPPTQPAPAHERAAPPEAETAADVAVVPRGPAPETAVPPETVPGPAEAGPAVALPGGASVSPEPVPAQEPGAPDLPREEHPAPEAEAAPGAAMEATPKIVPTTMETADGDEEEEPTQVSRAVAAGVGAAGSTGRHLSGWATLVGGVLMVVAAFLPWIQIRTGPRFWTGWDYASQMRGIRKLFIWDFWSTGFSPFFTGLAVVVAGGLLVLIAVAMLAARGGGTLALRAAAKPWPVIIAGLALIVGITNLVASFRAAATEWAFYLPFVGALLGAVGVAIALIARAARGPIASEQLAATAGPATPIASRAARPQPPGKEEPGTATEPKHRSRFLLVVGIIGLVLAAGLAADTLTCGFGLQGWRSSPCRPDMAVFWVFNFAPALAFAALVWQFRVRGTKREHLGALAALAFLGTALCGWAMVRFDPHHDCGSLGQVLDRPSLWLSTTPSPAYGANFCAVEWGRVAGYTLLGLLLLLVLIVLLVVQLVRSRRRRRVV
jgi:hypothetical protein